MIDRSKLGDKLNELVREFRDRIEPKHKKLAVMVEGARDNQRQLKEKVNDLQESLDYLRLCIKYQSFDLEATRRENEYFKGLLDRKRGNG